MTDRNLIWTRILVGIDQSSTAQHALHTAIGVMRTLGGELIIVSAEAGRALVAQLHCPSFDTDPTLRQPNCAAQRSN